MRTATLLTVVLLAPASSVAQPEEPARPETKRVIAGERYAKGGLYRMLFGSNHRDLWLTPLQVEVLNLQAFGDGLTPTRVVGHGQSRGLAFKGADGRLYTFRPLLKDPSGLLPVELRETFAKGFVTDQMASGHPAGRQVVPPLLEAAGVIHNEPRLALMPDDPALGEFRAEFKGLLGDIEEFGGSKGIVEAEENIDGEELWKRTRESPAVRVDARAYLRARLVDHLIGDWDRHRNQWRWARVPDQELWQPIPEDRDQAFVKFNGLVISLLRPGLPLLVDFGPKYPSMEGLTFDGWDVDKRLLAELGKPAFDEEAARVKAAITDAVIEEAVRGMPEEYHAKNGAALSAALKSRRDGLGEQAARFYRFLSKQVDIYGTDVAEVAGVDRAPSGDVTVTLAAEGQEPYFRRTFRPGETDDVRLRLFAGDDRVVTKGGSKGPRVRVVGGDGADVVDDSAGGRTRLYDSGADDRVIFGEGTSWNRKLYTPPPANRSGAWIPARDWGRKNIKMLRFIGGSDVGVVIAPAFTSTGYGFRKHPYADHHRLGLSYSTALNAFRATYDYDRRFEYSDISAGLTLLASGYDILRFYGSGNETPPIVPDNDAKIENDQLLVVPRVTLPFGRLELSLKPVLKVTRTEPKNNPIFGGGLPAETVGQIGAGFELRADTTDKPAWPSRGVKFWSGGHVYPKAWDLRSTIGDLHGEFTTYLSPSVPGRVTLMLRGGGKRVFGDYPYFESAFLGGRAVPGGKPDNGAGVVRGLRPQRYAGDGALYGNAELRVSLGDAFILVPGEIGLLGLYDIGRVYLEGERSSRWHRGAGGGIWFASPNRSNAVTLSVAKSEGRLAFYVTTGLAF